MSDDYLFDKSGSDREIESLERLLKPFAVNGAPRSTPRSRFFYGLVTLAAAALFAIGATQILSHSTARPSYNIVAGDREYSVPMGSDIGSAGVERRIDLGTDIGTVIAEPNAQIRIVKISDRVHKLRLEVGTLHASISAKARPGLFQVETPSTTCIDLGCKYTLSVDSQGRTTVNVETGRVAFQEGDREVYVPNGASCTAVPGRGSGIPIRNDSGESLRAAIQAFDRSAPAGRREAAKTMIGEAERSADPLVLWHLLQDRDDEILRQAVEAMVRVWALPEGVTAEGSLKRDAKTREAWKLSLFPEFNWLDGKTD